MKVLFVCSGNSKLYGISSITKEQGESLRNVGIFLNYFIIKGKGIVGYLKNTFKLRQYLKYNQFDLIHAHFYLSGIIASLAANQPIVVSLMGSDVKTKFICKRIITHFYKYKWNAVIVKSERMKDELGFSDAIVIPNGVDFSKFKYIDMNIARKKVHFNNHKYIIFVSNPRRKVKNIKLAKAAFELINNADIRFEVVNGVKHEMMPYYLNACNVLLLTSLWEGSPNVIKEALACNCPIVSTDVGDVRKMICEIDGCYVTSFNPQDIALKLNYVLELSKRTNAREKIRHLDSERIAKKIFTVYRTVLGEKIENSWYT